MNTPSLRVSLLAAVLATISASAAEAPLTAVPSVAIPGVALPIPPARSQRGIITRLEFKGGTLEELVAALNEGDPNANYTIIGEPADLTARVPAISLRDTEAFGLAASLTALLRPRDLSVSFSGSSILTVVHMPSFRPPTVANFQAFQIGTQLETNSLEDIQDAIRTAWNFAPGHNDGELQFKFHAATKALFVSGPPEAIAIAMQVVPQLRPGAAPIRTISSSGTLNPAEEAARLADWQGEIARRRAQRQDQGAAPVRPAPAPEKK